MLWFIITTGACNLRCLYCGGSFPDKYAPHRPRVSPEKVADFIARVDRSPVVFFYGGEPLVNPGFIRAVMDRLRGRAVFGIQTNGLLYRSLPDRYWAMMDTVLLSIDGREEITDKWRGRGVYRRVLRALRHLQALREKHGAPKTIIARMTVTQDTDIYTDVMHLLELGFDKAHWQLNAVWSEEWPLPRWARESYLPGLERLARWVAEDPPARLRRIVPFHGVASMLLHGSRMWTPCGAGRHAFTINSDGRILACPIAVREGWATLGHVDKGFHPIDGHVLDRCRGCPYYQVCGGRCLYAKIEEETMWGRELLEELDRVTRATFDIVFRIVVPAVLRAVERGEMTPGDVYYDPLLESTEVVP